MKLYPKIMSLPGLEEGVCIQNYPDETPLANNLVFHNVSDLVSQFIKMQRWVPVTHLKICTRIDDGTHGDDIGHWSNIDEKEWQLLAKAIGEYLPRLRSVSLTLRGVKGRTPSDLTDFRWAFLILQLPQTIKNLELHSLLDDMPITFMCLRRFYTLDSLTIKGTGLLEYSREERSSSGLSLGFWDMVCTFIDEQKDTLRNIEISGLVFSDFTKISRRHVFECDRGYFSKLASALHPNPFLDDSKVLDCHYSYVSQPHENATILAKPEWHSSILDGRALSEIYRKFYWDSEEQNYVYSKRSRFLLALEHAAGNINLLYHIIRRCPHNVPSSLSIPTPEKPPTKRKQLLTRRRSKPETTHTLITHPPSHDSSSPENGGNEPAPAPQLETRKAPSPSSKRCKNDVSSYSSSPPHYVDIHHHHHHSLENSPQRKFRLIPRRTSKSPPSATR